MAYSMISRNRVLLASFACGMLLFILLVGWKDKRSLQNLPRLVLGVRVNEPQRKEGDSKFLDPKWADEYTRRVQRVRDVCERDEIAAAIGHWRLASNRTAMANCSSAACPILVDVPKHLYYCFVPKVASRFTKLFLLNITGLRRRDIEWKNMFFAVNNLYQRVSPMYRFPPKTMHSFFKMIFVRHPFDRLVSAFRDKAEGKKSDVRSFYKRFWRPIMQKLRPTVSPSDQITFPEFIWHVTHTPEEHLNVHWAPFWSRCDPCLVDYDFIGKLETGQQDFPYAFQKLGADFSSDWVEKVARTSRPLTLEYFSRLTEESIRQLYDIFKLDFELFGYSLDGFLPRNNTAV